MGLANGVARLFAVRARGTEDDGRTVDLTDPEQIKFDSGNDLAATGAQPAEIAASYGGKDADAYAEPVERDAPLAYDDG